MKIAFILSLCVICTCSFTFNRSKSKNNVEHDLLSEKTGHKAGDHHYRNRSNSFIPKPIKFNSFGKCDKCSRDAKCVPPVQCPAHLKMSHPPQLCDLPGGGSNHGLCCTSGQNHTTKDFFHPKGSRIGSAGLLKEIFHEARIKLRSMMHNKNDFFSGRGQPDFFHHAMFGNPRPADNFHVSSLSHQGFEHMIASQEFKDKVSLSVEESQLNNFDINLKGSPFEKNCPAPITCHLDSIYRTADGTCNHYGEGKSYWGAAKTPMERILPPAFEDGIWAARQHAVDNSLLKSARTISRTVFPDVNRPHPLYNLMVMQFGQFLSHDFTQSSSITLDDGTRINCCSKDGSSPLPQDKLHFACMPIRIDSDDEFYSTFNQGCMNFVRLSIAPNHDCRLGYAKTLSKVSHYLDGSVIYGSDLKTQSDLRSFHNGQLKMFVDFNRELLPLHPNPDCVNPDKTHACFTAGDVRVNQHITLVALHLVFAREHNRVAGVLSELNPHWSDNVIFEEARRIVVAELQHITYNEWLPLIIGNGAMERFSLNINPHGYSNDYDDDVNPSMTNEFTGAAFRFGHSTVQGKLFVDHDHQLNEVIFLPDVFFNPSRLRVRHFYDEILRTLVNEPMQSVDNSVSFGLSRFLFHAGTPFGLDLISLNIQRGRDEALRPYSDYLEVNGQKMVERFDEFGPIIGLKLSQVYNSPKDMDLFVGGLMETSDGDSLVGPTFREIIADQFSRLRKGDRYFYEHNPKDNPGAFTISQLEELKHANLARVICDNADGIALSRQSPEAFIQNVPGNEPVPCNSELLPFINLLAWKEST